MEKVVLIDPNGTNRNSLFHQLESQGYDSILQFKSLTEANNTLSEKKEPLEGIVIASVGDDFSSLYVFLQTIRATHPGLAMIVTTDEVSLETVRKLVMAGVDHILLRPFNGHLLNEKINSAKQFRSIVLSEEYKKPVNNLFRALPQELSEKTFNVHLSGWIRENCNLPTFSKVPPDATLFINCDYLLGMNSIGVRSWILWFRTLEQLGFKRFEFEGLQPAVINQANIVHGFLPAHSAVNSFYIYYTNEDLDEERPFKISLGKEFSQDEMTLPRKRIIEVDGKSYSFEIDESIRKTLKFYKGYIRLV